MASNPVPWFVRQQAAQMHRAGPVRSATPGRADKLPIKVPSGAYVLPSAVISHWGQDNTDAGYKVADKMFKAAPAPKLTRLGRAEGGDVPPTDDWTDILISGGEYVIPPEMVAQLGGGDLNTGHEALDLLVKQVLKERAELAGKLPPPAKD